jgi:hypothetical protein
MKVRIIVSLPYISEFDKLCLYSKQEARRKGWIKFSYFHNKCYCEEIFNIQILKVLDDFETINIL